MRPEPKFKYLRPKRDKILECLLHLIQRADQQSKTVTQFDLVKSLFFADIAHLETYGRPVTYDNYVAMKHGPVASEAYDMLKPNYFYRKKFVGWPLWFRTPYQGNAYAFYNVSRPPDYKKLSKSDIRELNVAQDMVWGLGFGDTSDLSHEHRAYVAVWKKGRKEGSEDMDYRLIMPEGEEDRAEEILFVSHH